MLSYRGHGDYRFNLSIINIEIRPLISNGRTGRPPMHQCMDAQNYFGGEENQGDASSPMDAFERKVSPIYMLPSPKLHN